MLRLMLMLMRRRCLDFSGRRNRTLTLALGTRNTCGQPGLFDAQFMQPGKLQWRATRGRGILLGSHGVAVISSIS